MTLMQAVSEAVTARQAGELYGLHIDRRGKAVCPWHNDHKPSLSFKGNRCKCFACNNGGDAIDLTAQIYGLSLLDAAKKLQADFGIGVEVDTKSLAQIRATRRREQEAKAARDKQYTDLCAAYRESRDVLARLDDPETAWDNPDFVKALRTFALAQDALDGWG